MENVAVLPTVVERNESRNRFGLDTTLVVFFLAMDAGRTAGTLGLNEFVSLFTISLFVAFSYFLPSPVQKQDLPMWTVSKLFIAIIGVVSGVAFKVTSEVFLMENLKYAPMIFLILSGILCAATQIRGIIRVRLAG